MNTRKLTVLGGLVIALVFAAIAGYMVIMSGATSAPDTEVLKPLPDSPLNASYLFDGTEVTLVDGTATFPAAPDSAAEVTVRIFGEPVYGDLTDDGVDDAAVILTYDAGGSGTFYYVAAALKDGEGYLGTNAVLLGDRISPQNAAIEHMVLVANYAERAPGAAMTDAPSVAVSKYLTVSGATLVDTGPFEPGTSVMAGNVNYSGSTWSFAPCSGGNHRIASSSRSFAALETIYIERSRVASDTAPVFIVLAAGMSAGDASSTPSSDAPLNVVRILTAPVHAACR